MFTDKEIISFYNDPNEYIEYITKLNHRDEIQLCNDLETFIYPDVTDSHYFNEYVNHNQLSQWLQEINLLSVRKFIDVNYQIVSPDTNQSIALLCLISSFIDKLKRYENHDLSQKMIVELLDLWYKYSINVSTNILPLHVSLGTMLKFTGVVEHIITNYDFRFYYKSHNSLMQYFNIMDDDVSNTMLAIHQKNVNRYKIIDGMNSEINATISIDMKKII